MNRLEEIKHGEYNFFSDEDHDNDTERFNDDFKWLLDQVEKKQELEEVYEMSMLRLEELYKENKRYKEALKKVKHFDYSKEHYRLISTKALEDKS